MCSVMTVVHRWSVASCKLGYCLGVLLLFAEMLLVLGFVQPMQFGNFSCLVPDDQQGSAGGLEWLWLRGSDKAVVPIVGQCSNTAVPTSTTIQSCLKLMQLLPRDALHNITNETPKEKKIFTVKHQIWCKMCIDLDYGAVIVQLFFAGCMYTYFQIIFSSCFPPPFYLFIFSWINQRKKMLLFKFFIALATFPVYFPVLASFTVEHGYKMVQSVLKI